MSKKFSDALQKEKDFISMFPPNDNEEIKEEKQKEEFELDDASLGEELEEKYNDESDISDFIEMDESFFDGLDLEESPEDPEPVQLPPMQRPPKRKRKSVSLKEDDEHSLQATYSTTESKDELMDESQRNVQEQQSKDVSSGASAKKQPVKEKLINKHYYLTPELVKALERRRYVENMKSSKSLTLSEIVCAALTEYLSDDLDAIRNGEL